MKVFFDTNVHVAEALGGEAAEAMVDATAKASWRIFVSDHVLQEVEKAIRTLDPSYRFARLTRIRVEDRAILVEPGSSRNIVDADPDDTPILQAALEPIPKTPDCPMKFLGMEAQKGWCRDAGKTTWGTMEDVG